MIKQLFRVFNNPEPDIWPAFREMFELSCNMVLDASAAFWARGRTDDQRRDLLERDIRVNQLERRIRKQIVTDLHGAERSTTDGLLLMSLVKDVERIGDYAKNLAELVDLTDVEIPDDENVRALGVIRDELEGLTREACRAVERHDRTGALQLIQSGRGLTARCDELVEGIARADYPNAVTVSLALAARHYKRVAAHVLNVLTSLVMPLHKIDYFDEDSIVTAAE